MLEEYINILKPEVLKLFSSDKSGHDLSHLERTMYKALQICECEKGDPIIVGVAAFLHDVHRIIQNETKKYCDPKDSLPIIINMLKLTNLNEEQVKKILHSIEFHEEYNWNYSSNQEQDINTLILQDADNLDALGSIGIVRTINYGSAHNVPLYDPNMNKDSLNNYSEANGDDDSTVTHFYHKLLKLGDYMNTKTAKEMAKKRTEIMRMFVEELIEELEPTPLNILRRD